LVLKKKQEDEEDDGQGGAQRSGQLLALTVSVLALAG